MDEPFGSMGDVDEEIPVKSLSRSMPGEGQRVRSVPLPISTDVKKMNYFKC